MTRGRAVRAVLGVALAPAIALAAAGCGVPTGGSPSTIPPESVPFGLTAPSPSAAPTAPTEAVADASRVYWITDGDVVVPRVRQVSGTTPRERLAYLLDQLATGPTRAEQGEQLSSALPRETRLRVTGFEDGTATIDLDVKEQALSGVAGRRAVAQIVLSATSVPGVQAVLLELSGQPIEAPLPAGELTAGPLRAGDYASATSPPATAPPTGGAPQPEPVPAGPS